MHCYVLCILDYHFLLPYGMGTASEVGKVPFCVSICIILLAHPPNSLPTPAVLFPPLFPLRPPTAAPPPMFRDGATPTGRPVSAFTALRFSPHREPSQDDVSSDPRRRDFDLEEEVPGSAGWMRLSQHGPGLSQGLFFFFHRVAKPARGFGSRLGPTWPTPFRNPHAHPMPRLSRP